MKAVVCTQYGSPSVLQIQEVAKPTPKDDEILVRVRCATVTPSDCAFRKGDPFIVKLIYGLNKPRLSTQGVEFCGDVEAVGSGVTRFKVGDAVVGMSPDTFGAHAEYITLSQDKAIITKPDALPYAETLAIFEGTATALIFIRDVAKVQVGQSVLVNGASGSVGIYAVQLAKHFGARVTGVCSGANVALVKSAGADAVIDYTQTDFTKGAERYDVIFDAVGKRSYGECKGILKPNGVYMTTVPTLGIVFDMLFSLLGKGKKAKFATAGLMQSPATFASIKALIEEGALRAMIDRTYPMSQVVEAHTYVDTGRKKGNVILTMTEA
ncbi:MAG: NAD(P)-dependent alcohol dehydrogenase [Phototrophicaceae bacterium]